MAFGTAILCLLTVAAGVLIVVRETRASNRKIERKLAEDLGRPRAETPTPTPRPEYLFDGLFGNLDNLRVSVEPGITVTTTASQRCRACKALNRLRSLETKGARCGKCGLPLPAVPMSVRK